MVLEASSEKSVRSTNGLAALVETSNLHRAYRLGHRKLEVLRGVDLSIHAGEKVFLCGPSGAGKTTLLYTLAGLERPQKGKVLFQGHNLYKLKGVERARLRNLYMGYIFQNYYLLPELTALENVSLPGFIAGKQDKERAQHLLEKVGLKERLKHLPSELSGGEQQRVAIARSLFSNPRLIFADEPTGNLDSKNGEEVMNLLLSLVTQEGATLIVVTHDISLANLGDRILTVKDGQVS